MRRAGGTRVVHVCSIPLPQTNGLDAQKLPDAVISTARPKASSTSPSTTEVAADLRCRVHVPQFRARAVSRSRSCVPQSSPTCLPSPCAPTLGPHAPQMWAQSLAPFRCRTWRTAQAQPRRMTHTHTPAETHTQTHEECRGLHACMLAASESSPDPAEHDLNFLGVTDTHTHAHTHTQ